MTSVLEEKDSIRETMARYCFYTDSGQSEKYADLFTADCDWDGGPFGRCHDRATLLTMHRGGADAATKLRHFNTNIVITVNGHEAQATSYVAVIGVGDAAPTMFFAGTYVDRFVKQEGRWLFKMRRIVSDITTIKAEL